VLFVCGVLWTLFLLPLGRTQKNREAGFGCRAQRHRLPSCPETLFRQNPNPLFKSTRSEVDLPASLSHVFHPYARADPPLVVFFSGGCRWRVLAAEYADRALAPALRSTWGESGASSASADM
jgi:hypothetical protein